MIKFRKHTSNIIQYIILTGFVRTILLSLVRTTIHCSFFTWTRSALTSSIWSMKWSSGLVFPDSGCNSNLLGYSLAYLVCHADAKGPPSFFMYPWRMQSDSETLHKNNIIECLLKLKSNTIECQTFWIVNELDVHPGIFSTKKWQLHIRKLK